jgi:hypothetical protein
MKARIPENTYEVLAKCVTPKCKGTVSFGTTTSTALDLVEHIHNFAPKKAKCPICQRTASYSNKQYYPILLAKPK